MKKKVEIKKGITLAHIGFIAWLLKAYGSEFRGTHEEIAEKIGCVTYGSIRLYLIALERAKYLRIENKGKRSQLYILDMDKVNELMG